VMVMPVLLRLVVAFKHHMQDACLHMDRRMRWSVLATQNKRCRNYLVFQVSSHS
jgi:hypothetical protein